MSSQTQPADGALPFSDVTGLLAAAAGAEKQQALVARIFAPRPGDPATSSSVDHFALLSSLARQLKEYVRDRSRLEDRSIPETYIWHREPPSISVVSPPSSTFASSSKPSTQLPPHILFHLRTGGECIEDEWYATHLLIGASVHFAKHQLCITVQDEDGEFLLIEAAEYLPEWVAPETVSNRVWILDGHLHLVPPHHKSSDDGSLSVSSAVELVTDHIAVTRASDEIEAAAFARAYEFPSAAIPHHHRTLAYLPRRIARVLASEPQLIAHCVTAIQSRDVVSSRSGSRLVHFPSPSAASAASKSSRSESSDNDDQIVLTSVRMTRHLYAQLLYDRFFPPRQLGPQWQAAVENYRLRTRGQRSATASHTEVEDEGEVSAKIQRGRWHDLGAKIWCGMEMAYTESLARRTRTRPRPMHSSEMGLSTQEKSRLISALDKLGYFRGELEGSAKWKILEAEAVAQYLKGSSAYDNSEADTGDDLLCDNVDRILQQASSGNISPTILPTNASPETLSAAEDDDSWLQLNPDDIESILQTKAGTGHSINEADTFQRLGAFNEKMEDFVRTKSDIRGALFEDELDAEEELDDDDLLFEDIDEEGQEDRIRKEVQKRMKVGGEMQKKALVERLIPRLSESEWTRKTPNDTTTGLSGDAKGKGKDDFLSSIDSIAANRSAAASQQASTRTEIAVRNNNLSAAHEELRRRLDSQYMRDTSNLLASQGHEQFDGASDSDGELEQESSPEVRRQLAKEYDIEPDRSAGDAEGWEEDMEMEEPEMDEETEVSNLLEFARVSLGLTQEQYAGILEERKSRGKYVPTSERQRESLPKKQTQSDPAAETPLTGASLTTFESVMSEMERQLHTLQSRTSPPSSSSTKPKSNPNPNHSLPKVHEQEDQELLAHLVRSGSDLPSSLLRQLGSETSEQEKAEQMEAFLRSFQAQAGTNGPGSGSGPVDVLMRRFGLGSLPADQDPH